MGNSFSLNSPISNIWQNSGTAYAHVCGHQTSFSGQ